MCVGYIDLLDMDEYEPKNYQHYIYEAAIEAVYGPDVWKWINKKIG